MSAGLNDLDSPKPYSGRYFDVPEVPGYQEIAILGRKGSAAVELAPAGDGPVELEIGFGRGRFLLGRAETNPGIRFVGLETRRKLVDLVASRTAKRNLSNVKVWLGDARYVLGRLDEEECLSRVFIHFPDPWWKARHVKRILVTSEIVGHIARLLKRGGELFIQTDVDFRARLYRDVLLSNKELGPATGAPGAQMRGNRVADISPFLS
jgi:tRNA (guanine-N7-)-methyltransferase